jgi:chemotaxis protein MotB
MKKEKEEPEEPSAPFWMTTFSDMVTLLLVFFILILSYSTVELEKFRGAMSSMKGALGIMPEMGSSVPNRKPNFHERMTVRNTKLTERMQSFDDAIKQAKAEGMIETEVTASGLHIRLGDNVLYDLGKARIKPSAYPILREVAALIREESNDVYVEGHTDNIPISTAKFPSNWELSTARAMSVVKYLYKVEGISASKLAAVGHGEYRPLVPNTTRENRSRNRRVEIFIKWE